MTLGPPSSSSARIELLRADVAHLAGTIGPRHPGRPEALAAAVDWLASRLHADGLQPRREAFAGMVNLVAEAPGIQLGPAVLLGAHYDSVPDVANAPGADDNASGVAAVLALAARLVREPLPCSVRVVFFANEEGMRWGRERGGSWAHAKALRPGELRSALILDAVAHYDARAGTQAWPAWWMPWLYGSRGDFLCVQAAWRDRALARRCRLAARGHGLPVRGCWWPGQTWQLMGDQESFLAHGVPTITLTDTDRFRNPRFHKTGDRPETLDYAGLELAVEAAWAVLRSVTAIRRGPPTS